jgi:tetratricopeptide (TPR) repeat protein
MAWLGWACYGNGHAKKAEELLAEAYTTAHRTLGEKDTITLECMFYYGGTLILRGRYADAERMLADALRLAQGVLNPNHPFFLYPAALLGRLYSREGQYKEAEKLLSNALTKSREAWGENNGGTFHNMAALAENYARQGLIDDAEKLMLEPLGAGDGSDGSASQVSIQNLTYLGFFYLWQKNYNDAERWASKALKASLESIGEDHPITFLCRMALGMVYREQGRYDEAETQFTKLLPMSEPYITDESVHVANLMHQLAALYQQQGRYAEAEKLHLGVLNIRRNQLVENHPHTLGTIRGLIALYTAWGKPREARKWFSELKTAYANQSAACQYTRARGNVNYEPATEVYTLTAPTPAPWEIEKELDFSYPEPTSEMWHVCDDVQLSYKTLHGDGSVAAKIESIDPAHYGIQAGVMIRDTLNPTSPYVSIAITPSGDIVFQCRTVELGATHSTRCSINSVELPHWVRLTRKGNRFTAQHSDDGIEWESVIYYDDPNMLSSVEITMNETVHIGLAVRSNNSSRTAEARLSNVDITGSVTPDGPLTLSCDINLQKLPDLKD